METLYPAMPLSPATTLTVGIDDEQTTIAVVDAAKLPAAPNLATIGTNEDAEVILYTGKDNNDLTGVTRGVVGAAKAWDAGTQVARLISSKDINDLQGNLAEHLAEDAQQAHGLGSGAVVQTVTVVSTTTEATTSATYQNSLLEATITPKHADSKLIVMTGGYGRATRAAGTLTERRGAFRLYNDTNAVVLASMFPGRSLASASDASAGSDFPIAMLGVYTVNSTAARTFRVQYRSLIETNIEVSLRGADGPATMIIMEVRP